MTNKELLELLDCSERENSEELDLTSKALAGLPPQLWQLKSLKRLRLGCNQLRKIPDDIAQLSDLEWLDLYGNELVEIPDAIAQLSNLQILLLSGNRLEAISASILKLPKLRILDLSQNCLKTIPEMEANTSNLEWLDISNNQVDDIVYQFKNIRFLDLSNNKITEISRSIFELKKLRSLDIRINPISILIPSNILESYWNVPQILAYYFRQKDEKKRPINEAKVIFVGQGYVGKTSLLKRLVDGDFNSNQDQTDGIDIRTWDIQIREETVRLHLWDFGGQDILHATHQFFLTERSLYLLVLNTRADEHANQLYRWLKLIKSFGKDSPILIVGNQTDQRRLDLNKKDLQAQSPNIKGFFETSCFTGEGIDELRSAIIEQVSTMESVFKPMPQSYFNVKEKLEKMAQKGLRYIPYSDYEKICIEEGITNSDEHRILIKTLHNIGIALNFADDDEHRATLRVTNVLNPRWIVEGVYKIINNNFLLTETKGVLHWEDQSCVFQSSYPRTNDSYISQTDRDFVIEIMDKFKLCFKLELSDKPAYLFPALLPKDEPDTGDWLDALHFELHYDTVIPQSIISRFIIKSHSMISKKTYWRTGVVLKLKDARAEVKVDFGNAKNKIVVRVTGNPRTRRDLLSIIRHNFDVINKSIPTLCVDEYVPLPDQPEAPPIRYGYLLDLEKEGIEEHLFDKAKRKYNVKTLLDGIEDLQFRSDREKFRTDNYSQESPHIIQIITQQKQITQTQRDTIIKENTVNQKGDTMTKAHQYISNSTIGNIAEVNSGLMIAHINDNKDDIARLMAALRKSAQAFPEEQKEEALMELDDLESDLNTPEKQNPKRIGKRFQRLIAAGTAAAALAGGAATFSGDLKELATNVNEFTTNAIELGEKIGIEIKLEQESP